jgi:long-chain acyl-CoA synthetase
MGADGLRFEVLSGRLRHGGIDHNHSVTPRNTLVDYFHDLVAIRGDFLVYDDSYRHRVHTYEEVGRAARGFAARLSAAAIGRGDTVIIWGENRPEWIACYWGCVLAGVVVVPIDYRSSADFVRTVQHVVRSKAVVLGDDVRNTAGAASTNGAPAAAWWLRDLDWQADAPWPDVPLSGDDVVQIIFTSGATAEPKGVVITHRNVLANVVPVEREVTKYRAYARPFHPLRFLNLLPLSHMFGQSMATTVPPMVRGTVIFTRSFNPHDLMRLVKSRRVSVFVSVPKILDVLRDHVARAFPEAREPAAGLSIPARWWRYRRVHAAFGMKFWAFVVGAAPLPPDLEEFWRRLGFVVIQGYGLTETAPIVALNHPFKTSRGSVGTPIGGVEVRIAEDGEILVRGENVTRGYYDGTRTASVLDEEGWLHTGDIGERDDNGRLFIKGRKKEMIVTPEGLNVFPEDVERVLDALPGVRESAVVGVAESGQERVHAALVLEPGTDSGRIVREANARLLDHQRIRTASVWPASSLPRTEGTKKLKRRAIRDALASGAPVASDEGDSVESIVARFAHGRALGGATTLEELGLSSLERVELMVALEDRFQTRLDETRFAESSSLADLEQLVARPPEAEEVASPVDFPSWNRARAVALVRRLSLATWILPLARVFARVQVDGLERLSELNGPVVFASNHTSHMDVPVILCALPASQRALVAPAMAKEFFKAHFFPRDHSWRNWFTNSVNYYLAAFFFNAFPLPQREAGAHQTLKYIGELTGDGWSVLIFPEGLRSPTGAIQPFRPGIGMIAARLDVPIVPVRVDGADTVLPTGSMSIRPGRVRVVFGTAIRLRGDDYAALASRVEEAVRML